MMPFTLRGTVVHGKHIGRTIGYPTANVQPHGGQPEPPRGVFAGEIRIEDEPVWRACLVNHGMQPTLPSGRATIEAHILDFCGDLYGADVELRLLRPLRPERRFGSVEELTAQLARDVLDVRTKQ